MPAKQTQANPWMTLQLNIAPHARDLQSAVGTNKPIPLLYGSVYLSNSHY